MFKDFEEYLNKIEPCKLKINILHDLGYKNKSSEFDYVNPINLYLCRKENQQKLWKPAVTVSFFLKGH